MASNSSANELLRKVRKIEIRTRALSHQIFAGEYHSAFKGRGMAFSEVREALEKAGIPMMQAEVTMIPQNYVELTDDDDIKKMNRILDLLDEDDDVQAVFHNWSE